MHFFNAIIGQEERAIEAQILQLSATQSIEAAFETIYKVDTDLRSRASLFIVRSPVEFPLNEQALSRAVSGDRESINNCPEFLKAAIARPDETFGRVSDSPVLILSSFGHRHFLSENINPFAQSSPLKERGISVDQAIADIRAAELTTIVEASRARLPKAPGLLYRALSARLMKSFLRVGNVQYTRAAIDAFFFWLLPHLANCKGLLIDTWSISSIAINASRLLSIYSGAAPCPVEMLSRYHDGSDARSAESAEIVDRIVAEAAAIGLGDASEVVCLMSATHSGRLVAQLQEALRFRAQPPAVRFVALFKLGADAELEALSDLSQDSDFASVSPAEEKNIVPVEIDPQVYFPLAFRDVEHVVREPQTKAFLGFLQRYKGAELFRVHKDHQDDGPRRHHGIYLDTAALIEQAPFRDRYREILLKLSPVPNVILTPPHNVGVALGNMALEILRHAQPDIRRVEHSNLFFPPSSGDGGADHEVAKIIDGVPEDGAIAIIDDAFITGSRLAAYQRHLRSRSFDGQLHYLVAIARPRSIAFWKERQRMLSFRPERAGQKPPRHTVQAVEEIVIPDWRDRDCPWCRERDFYLDLAASNLQISAHLQERLARLQTSADDGLVAGLFLELPKLPALRITRGSFFADKGSSESEVFAGVAAAFQRLRTEPVEGLPLLGPRRFPVCTVMKASEYLFDTYNDPILRACFLRGAFAEELVYAATESERLKADLGRTLMRSTDPTDKNISLELLLAFALGRFVHLSDAELTSEDFQRVFEEEGLRAFALELAGRTRQ